MDEKSRDENETILKVSSLEGVAVSGGVQPFDENILKQPILAVYLLIVSVMI